MNSLMEQLHDIEGLDAISWWPLALGWWVLIAASLLLVGASVWFIARRLAFRRSWKYDTFQKLALLEMKLNESVTDATIKETAITLSEYLRRIALRRFSRKECAGLVGEAWLQWLSRHDSKNFDWKNKGRLLIEAPYAPANSKLSVIQIKELIQAAKDWVHSTSPRSA